MNTKKQQRILNAYKKRLCEEVHLSDGTVISEIRFNCIQYLCSFPGIEPVEMAASLQNDGFTILFDDSSISKQANAANRAAVNKAAKTPRPA